MTYSPIMLTGGSGLLGTELQKLIPNLWAPLRKEIDITNPFIFKPIRKINWPTLIIHAAAYTDVDGAEDNKEQCWRVNVDGTRNIAAVGVPMLYISTNSVFDGEEGMYAEHDIPNPTNFYSLTKLLGEQLVSPGSRVVRTSFRKSPWEYPSAYEDRFTSAEYVEETAKKIAWCVENFRKLPSVLHVGGPRVSYYELARRSSSFVLPGKFQELRAKRQLDLSFDTKLWESLQ